MKAQVMKLDGSEAGSIDLADEVFGLEPRADILQRVVRWQQLKKQAGTHKTKGRSEIKATSKKMYRQKGTGSARHGNKAAPQFRGGGKAFGPVVRSHAIDLPKKVRALGLKHALSAKAKTRVADDRRRPRDGGRQDLGAGEAVRRARPRQRAGRRRQPRSTPASAARRATCATSMCCRSRASTSTTSCAATRWC